jgi:hypothetical protein
VTLIFTSRTVGIQTTDGLCIDVQAVQSNIAIRVVVCMLILLATKLAFVALAAVSMVLQWTVVLLRVVAVVVAALRLMVVSVVVDLLAPACIEGVVATTTFSVHRRLANTRQ